MGRFHGGVLIWDELGKVCERKMGENAKIPQFLAKTRRWYRYNWSGTGTMMQWAISTGTTQTGTGTDWQWMTGTGTGQSGTGTTTSSSPVLTCFCIVKSRIRTLNV